MDAPFSVALRLRDGFAFEVNFDAAALSLPAVLDEPPPLGRASGPSGIEAAAAGIAHALSAALLFALRRSNIDVTDLHTVVSGEPVRCEQGIHRIRELHVVITPSIDGANPRIQELLDGFEDESTLANSFRMGMDLVINVVLPEAGSRAAPAGGTDDPV
jgi:hypothetical protein